MNELLQKHGCSNVFTIPEGLKELMADITREVLRDQPPDICDYIANYLSVLLITREHGIMAVKILDDLCDCRPTVSEHLLQHGMDVTDAQALSQIIKEEVEGGEPLEGKETVKETQILKKILGRTVLDEDMAAKVCQVARNAFRDYWYRKKLMEKNLKVHPNEPWEIAAERTLQIYKRTKPSFNELSRATQKIQDLARNPRRYLFTPDLKTPGLYISANTDLGNEFHSLAVRIKKVEAKRFAAYRGYHVRRNILRHLKPKSKKKGGKVELPGPPLDVADSREIDLGPYTDLKVREVDTTGMFNEVVSSELGIQYDPMKTIKLLEDSEFVRPRSALLGESDDELKLAKFDNESKMANFEGGPKIAKSEADTKMAKFEDETKMPKSEVAMKMAKSEVETKMAKSEVAMKMAKSEVETKMAKFEDEPKSRVTILDEQKSAKFEEPVPTRSGSRTAGVSAKVSGLSSTLTATSAAEGMASEHDSETQPPQSLSQHKHTSESLLQKTSFVETPGQVEETSGVPEEIIAETKTSKELEKKEDELEVVEVPTATDVDENKPADTEHNETEIPEEIPDDRTEGNESALTASFPSSAPDTANTTDVEDTGEMSGYDEQ